MGETKWRQQVADLRQSAQAARKERDDARRECAQWVDKVAELEAELAATVEDRVQEEVERGRSAEAGSRAKGEVVAHPMTDLAEPLRRVAEGKATLADIVRLATAAWPEQLYFLPSALRSAEAASDFDRPLAALSLLARLAMDYRDGLLRGEGDRVGLLVFGEKFAATESETVRRNENALRLRTFEHSGRSWEMLRHLKIGTKPSDAKTLRIHFVWDARSGRVLVGHCGRHLDFR